jgi:predicted dehydrogenase
VVAALIGCGGRGQGLLSIHNDPGCTLAAVCDVDRQRADAARQRIGAGDAYQDFRRILDRPDIDAVLIATPDHWHAAITVLACQAGKDVYCEKPLCRTIHEGRRMVEAARRYSRVVQMGTQYRSIARTRQACEWVRNGRLGKVHTVRLSHASNPVYPCEAGRPVPPQLDWDLWLGPAPWAPYHPQRSHFSFRWFMDYGSGFIADNGVHMFSVVS